MEYLLGVDLGSTSLKAVIYDLDGNAVASGSRPTELVHPDSEHPQWAVWQPDQIFDGAAAAMREGVARLNDPKSIKALAVTGMGMDGVPVDEDGRWLYPFISWHDPRTGPQFEWFKEHVTAEKVFSIGGNLPWPINSVMRILWMAEHEPSILGRTDKWLLIEDFVNFMLCGRRATDHSMASCTALFDQCSRSWSDELLSLAGVDRRLLCDAYPSGTLLGEVHARAAEATGLAEGTPVVLGGHDHLCGALPVGGFRPGVVLDVTGTWEIVQAATAEPVLSEPLRTAGLTVQAHVARGIHATWGSSVAGEMLEWYRGQFGPAFTDRSEGEAGDWDALMTSAADSPPGARGVMFLPHMSGVSCPVVDPGSRGAFVGLSNLATKGDMLRAIIEGLDYQFLDIVAAMETGLGVELERFVAVGGAVRTFWMQNKADVVGRPIEVPAVEEATPLGAAILAGIGVGLYQDEDDAFRRVYKPGTTYHPNAEAAARYAEWFKIYRDLYPALRPVSHQLL
ncbi:MAG: FGGY-family carbohydrate kinase [Planctomycetota bacterium]|jgi:xylulokinase